MVIHANVHTIRAMDQISSQWCGLGKLYFSPQNIIPGILGETYTVTCIMDFNAFVPRAIHSGPYYQKFIDLSLVFYLLFEFPWYFWSKTRTNPRHSLDNF